MGFYDVDEFLVLRKHRHVINFLYDHCPTGELGINWYLFFTSGLEVYEPLPVTKRFVYRSQEVDQHVKSFVKVTDLDLNGTFHPHFFSLSKKALRRGAQHVDTNGTKIKNPHPGPWNPNGPTDIAVMHHYNTKSRKKFVYKRMRGRADIGNTTVSSSDAVAMSRDLPKGEVWDNSAWQLLRLMDPKYQFYDDETRDQ